MLSILSNKPLEGQKIYGQATHADAADINIIQSAGVQFGIRPKGYRNEQTCCYMPRIQVSRI